MSFKLGFLNRAYGRAWTPQIYQDALELFSAAEDLGFDTGWLAQHHLGSEGWLPSPLLALAAAAQRTTRIQLGTAVVVLPQEQPLRLAEDAAVLDHLSNGRLQLGLGSGFDPLVAQAWGQTVENRHALFEEHLQVLHTALDGQPLDAAGQHLSPRAIGLRQRLWQAGSQAEAIAEQRNGLILAPSPAAPELLQRYTARSHALGHAPRAVLVRGVFPGAQRGAVEQQIGPDIARYVARQQAIGVLPAQADAPLAQHLQQLGVVHGSPQEVTDALAQDPLLPKIDHFVVQVQTESTSLDTAIRRLRHVAEEIAPALGWQRPSGTTQTQETIAA